MINTGFKIFLFCFFSFSCNNEKPAGLPITNRITLLIKNAKVNTKVSLKNGSVMNIGKPGDEIFYFNDDYYFTPIQIQYVPTETINIPIQGKSIGLSLVFKAFDDINFLANNGDSLLIDYEEDYPKVSLLNRKSGDADFLYETLCKKVLYSKNDFPAYIKLPFPPLFVQDFIKADSMETKWLSEASSERERERRILDSLSDNDKISKEVFGFYKAKNALDFEAIRIHELKNSYKRPDWTKNDTLARYSFHRKYLFKYLNEIFEKNVKKIKTSNSNIIDYRLAFDKVKEGNELDISLIWCQ